MRQLFQQVKCSNLCDPSRVYFPVRNNDAYLSERHTSSCPEIQALVHKLFFSSYLMTLMYFFPTEFKFIPMNHCQPFSLCFDIFCSLLTSFITFVLIVFQSCPKLSWTLRNARTSFRPV